jgi:hypothetical protein
MFPISGCDPAASRLSAVDPTQYSNQTSKCKLKRILCRIMFHDRALLLPPYLTTSKPCWLLLRTTRPPPCSPTKTSSPEHTTVTMALFHPRGQVSSYQIPSPQISVASHSSCGTLYLIAQKSARARMFKRVKYYVPAIEWIPQYSLQS